jgi:ribokinase
MDAVREDGGMLLAVVVVGSVNLDITARIDRIPAVGETRLAEDGWLAPGGKGANQALAARRQGAETRLIGMVGDDQFGPPALSLLEAAQVDLSEVRRGQSGTGLALIWLDPRGRNTITVLPGANHELSPSALQASRPVGPQDIVLISLEIPVATAAAAAAWARRGRARVLLDPAPAPSELPPELWRVDVLMPNQGEAATLLGAPIRDVKDAKAAARALRQRGAGIGMVKLGAEGVVWATRQGVFYLPAVPIEPVDTTGAGDAFAGVLAAGLSLGETFSDAVRRATQAAALACTRRGAQPSFPLRAEVDRALAP